MELSVGPKHNSTDQKKIFGFNSQLSLVPAAAV